jgi:hypothetical protein
MPLGCRCPQGAQEQRNQLENFERCGSEAKGEHILALPEGVFFGKAFNIAWVIQHARSFRLDERRIELVQAAQTPMSVRGNVRTPLRSPEPVRWGPCHMDPSVNNRD